MNEGRRILGSLRARLMVSYLGVSVAAIAVGFVTVRLTAPSFFDHHVGNMAAMHDAPGQPMTADASALDEALARSLNEGFLVALAVVVPLAGAASYFLARQVSRPVRVLAAASERVAAGDYSERVVETAGPVDLQHLAQSFNQMAEALEGVEQRRVELIGDVAHELRTPITVLHGYVEGLADGVFPASPETWARLSEETTRLGALAAELQELSRAQAGQLAVAIAPVNPGEAILAAAERMRPVFAQRGLDLRVEGGNDLPQVAADQERLGQVLSSLLSNALRYTSPPGIVTLAARRQDEGVVFVVRDTGIGIAAEHLPHVFERFYRIERSRARASGGTGIGLTIARALVIAMGGTLTATSPGVGGGSTFTLFLPAA